ncbi:MAG: LysE family translocator [Alphaproteobacteria bacterium]|nr:LysE family translocator [Alphaproteobacteria bacterium]
MPLNPDLLVAYLAVATLLAISPGPDTMFVLASSASGGPRNGVAATLGIASGGVVHASAAALGVSALIAASPVAFDVLRIGGALYLAWIGAQALYRVWRGMRDEASMAHLRPVSAVVSYRRGLVTNVFNPKVAIFYVAFLPQFADASLGHVPLQIFLLGCVHNLIGSLWLAGLATASGRAVRALARSTRVRAWLDGTAGVIYLLLAARIVFLERRTA